MLTSVRYQAQAGTCVWPIPFPFGAATDVKARLIDPSGMEKQLGLNRDFAIQGGNVVCIVPAGHSLMLYLDGVLEEAVAANAARALAYASPVLANSPAASPVAIAQPEAVAQADDPRISELEAKLDKLLAMQAEAQTKALAQAQEAAKDEQIKALAQTGAAQRKAVDDKTDLAVESIELAAEQAEQKLNIHAVKLLATAADIEDAVAAVSDSMLLADAAAERANQATEHTVTTLKKTMSAAEASLDEAATAGESRLATAVAQGEAQVRAASELAARDAAIASRLAGQAWPQQGWMAQRDELAKGSVMALPEPLRYYPGRNSLFIAVNNYVLTLGKDFEEVGAAANLSNTVRWLMPVHAGDTLNFWIAPTNMAQAASEYADAAAKSAHNAAASAARAETAIDAVQAVADKAVTQGTAKLNEIGKQGEQAVRNVAAVRDNAKTEISAAASKVRTEAVNVWNTASADLRKLHSSQSEQARAEWRKAQNSINETRNAATTDIKQNWKDATQAVADARKQAQDTASACEQASRKAAKRASKASASAHYLADCAWRAAFQASIDRAQPGMGSVPCYQDLALRPSGFYVINPLLRSALPFMGIFPAEKIQDIAGYDGFFVIGAQPYPEDIRLPELPYPANPEDVPEMRPPASNANWLPCGHHHN